MSPLRRIADAKPFEGSRPDMMPDMMEVVRLAPQAGRGPALVVSHRKMTGAVLTQLRRLADETDAA